MPHGSIAEAAEVMDEAEETESDLVSEEVELELEEERPPRKRRRELSFDEVMERAGW